jgi:hypothetical protein
MVLLSCEGLRFAGVYGFRGGLAQYSTMPVAGPCDNRYKREHTLVADFILEELRRVSNTSQLIGFQASFSHAKCGFHR